MRNVIAALSLAGLLSIAPARAGAGVIIANAGFEQPDLFAHGLRYSPSLAAQGGDGWLFHNFFAGIAADEDAFSPGTVPEGDQVGLIQQWFGMGRALSGFSQVIEGFDDGLYSVSFYAAGREGYGGANPFVVQIDDSMLTFNGSAVVTPLRLSDMQGYQYFTSDPIALSAGSHTLRFQSAGPVWDADRTSFIDAVSVGAVPEPSSLILLGSGLVILLGRGRIARCLGSGRAVS